MLFKDVAGFTASGFAPRVVIVGSGPAGLALALRLAERKLPSLVIEAGGFEASEASQDFYRGSVVGDPYFDLHEARLRQFGGTSGHWTGWCRALEAIDFAPRPYIPHSGWPIRKGDLDPYAAAANALLQVEPVMPDRPLTPEVSEIEIAFSPVRLAQTHRAVVERSPAIGLLLHTAVKELLPGGGRIAAVKLAGADAREHELRVPVLALCTGGIENSRILLWSNARHGGRVVPGAQTLGRYWMEHPNAIVGDALLFDGATERLLPRGVFVPTAAAQRARAIGSAHMRPMNAQADDTVDAKDLLRDALCVAPDLFSPMVRLAGKELLCGAQVRIEAEQAPHADNRIELAREADAHGVPRVLLHWRKREFERKTMVVATRLYGEALIRNQLGRLRLRSWIENGEPFAFVAQMGGWHHMGGTRMAESPAGGVVDRNCKVFGVANLYVGGSSVFVTGGYANPTYTIVQLALRLADHLADTLGGKP